jgi:alanine racemase
MLGNTVEIDLEALRYNFGQVRNLVGQSRAILAVVKSDAYGHGMVTVARELVQEGAEYLGVSTCREALTLREHGIKCPVLLLLGFEPDECSHIVTHDLTPVLYRKDVARHLSSAAVAAHTQVPVHLKIDTGMGRLGVPFAEAEEFFEFIRSLEGIRVEGLLSHFASADEPDKTFTNLQLQRFRQALSQAEAAGLALRYVHIANSAGVIDVPDSYHLLVRPGIMLYGSLPSAELHRPIPLKPVMSLKTRVVQLKEVAANSPIGYGCTYVTSKPSLIATLPVGYDDGYSRLFSNQGEVLIRGRRAPVVGRVSMCLTTVDVTEVSGVQVDDEVVFLGRQEDDEITGDELAARAGTISYEVFCNLGRLREKRYVHSSVS